MKVTSVMDSGAGVSVAPREMCTHIPLTPSEGSRRGQTFTAASGHKVHNEGQRSVQGLTEDGSPVSMQYQVAKVTRPLNAVSKICDRGNVVVFTARGGTIHNLWTGRKTPFGRERGIYTLNTWVKTDATQAQSFPGQHN